MKRKYTIGILGDSHLHCHSPKWNLSKQIGMTLIDSGYRIATGGLHGVAEAVSLGGFHARSHTTSDIIAFLPGNYSNEANTYSDIIIPTGLGLARNVLLSHSDAVIAIGGGAGTLSEIAFAWQFKKLIIALRVDGWSGKLADTKVDHRTRFESIADDQVYGATTSEEAIAILNNNIDRYVAAYLSSARIII